MAKKEKIEAPINKVKQAEYREILRSQIHLAAYNPRKITDEAKKLIKDNLKRVGLLGGIVWNETTGNLVSGHQRVAAMDAINRYDSETNEHDYPITVSVAQLSEKEEKEQNLFMNNKNAQGTFDDDMLRDLFADIDYSYAGFDDFDVQMLGLGEPVDPVDPYEDAHWSESQLTGGKKNEDGDEEPKDEFNQVMTNMSEQFKKGEENKSIDRSTNFYEDSPENQLARHAEVEKIKNRISNQNDTDKDNGALSYVVISFRSPGETDSFLDMFGFPFGTKYINGAEFVKRLEFGYDGDEPPQEDEE